MALTTREMIILASLMLCMPAQYWLVAKFSTGTRPQQALTQLSRHLKSFQWLWFESLNWWKRWYLQFVSQIRRTILGGGGSRIEGECPAKEVAMYRERTGYFGLSPLERPQRPGYIRYRVGQVVKLIEHEQKGSLGVIIGWDLYARAPESWLKSRYDNDAELIKEPHYRILLSAPLTREIYVAQRQLKVLRATQINHPRLAEMFSHFDGAQYIPKTPLKLLYPLD